MAKILNYFRLWDSASYGEGRSDLVSNILLYVGIALGVLIQQLLTGEEAKLFERLTPVAGIRSFLIAAVILPAIYKATLMHRREPNFFKFFICVQQGYFWPQIIRSIGDAFQASGDKVVNQTVIPIPDISNVTVIAEMITASAWF